MKGAFIITGLSGGAETMLLNVLAFQPGLNARKAVSMAGDSKSTPR